MGAGFAFLSASAGGGLSPRPAWDCVLGAQLTSARPSLQTERCIHSRGWSRDGVQQTHWDLPAPAPPSLSYRMCWDKRETRWDSGLAGAEQTVPGGVGCGGGVLPHEQTCVTYCRQLELPETHRGCALGTFWKSGERAPAGKVREGAVSLRPLLPCVEQCHPVCRHHQRSFLDLLETEWLVMEHAAQKQCRVPRLRQLRHGPLQRRSSFFKRSAFEPWTGFPGLLEQVATDWVSYRTRILSSRSGGQKSDVTVFAVWVPSRESPSHAHGSAHRWLLEAPQPSRDLGCGRTAPVSASLCAWPSPRWAQTPSPFSYKDTGHCA